MTSASILNVLTLNLFPSKDYSGLRYTFRTLCGTAIAIAVMAYLAHATHGRYFLLGWLGAVAVVAVFLIATVKSYRIFCEHDANTVGNGLFNTSSQEWSYIWAPFFYTVGWLFNAFVSVLTFFIVLVWG
jgi:hypothetical protein